MDDEFEPKKSAPNNLKPKGKRKRLSDGEINLPDGFHWEGSEPKCIKNDNGAVLLWSVMARKSSENLPSNDCFYGLIGRPTPDVSVCLICKQEIKTYENKHTNAITHISSSHPECLPFAVLQSNCQQYIERISQKWRRCFESRNYFQPKSKAVVPKYEAINVCLYDI